MEWFWSWIDRLLGAIAVGVFGVAGSQLAPLIGQYVTRAAAHLAAAEAKFADIQTGLKYQVMAETVRADLAAAARAEIAAAKADHDPVAIAGIVTKPFRLWQHADSALFDETWRNFVPALPTTAEAVTYTVIGVLLGFLVYEVLRIPAVAIATGEPKRRFRRKG
jgi:hypothetical protein